jgi:iron complex outermembrane receptor protein
MYAQVSLDSIQYLDEVILSDVKLKRFANGYKVRTLSDSILSKNRTSLTDVLRFNSNIYFKENGYGMVSSPSFRGTNASQTAVIWNGININSPLNGQLDFNTMVTSNFNSLTIRSGGGSVQYGSGAIGGSIHLSNDLKFGTPFEHQIQLGYGSFNSKALQYKSTYGSQRLALNLGVAYKDSDNDYKFLGSDRRNENSAFDNLDITMNLGYVLSKKHVLKLYHNSFNGSREFSSTLVAPSNSKYENQNYRTMVEWSHINTNYTSSLKAVHLSEQFKYFENKNNDNYSKGLANTWILKHLFKYDYNKRFSLSLINDYSYIKAKGNSFADPYRHAYAATLILDHRPTSKLQYTINLRKDVISDFSSPMVFSLDANYQVLKWYTLKLNASKNFRTPTFNDLYWNPGGNLELKPETSYQVDLGHQFSFKSFLWALNTYYIETSDLIQWRPNSTTGYWNPVNIANAKHYGLEVEMSYGKRFGTHAFLTSLLYSYTKARDEEKDEALFYVPEHKATASLSYAYKSWSLYYQHLFNGEVAIIGDTLNGFDVGNMGVGYTFQTKKSLSYALDVSVINLYNTYYENVALRPMPNRTINTKLTFKF